MQIFTCHLWRHLRCTIELCCCCLCTRASSATSCSAPRTTSSTKMLDAMLRNTRSAARWTSSSVAACSSGSIACGAPYCKRATDFQTQARVDWVLQCATYLAETSAADQTAAHLLKHLERLEHDGWVAAEHNEASISMKRRVDEAERAHSLCVF